MSVISVKYIKDKYNILFNFHASKGLLSSMFSMKLNLLNYNMISYYKIKIFSNKEAFNSFKILSIIF